MEQPTSIVVEAAEGRTREKTASLPHSRPALGGKWCTGGVWLILPTGIDRQSAREAKGVAEPLEPWENTTPFSVNGKAATSGLNPAPGWLRLLGLQILGRRIRGFVPWKATLAS